MKMDKFKINFNKNECIGCSACVSVCNNWVTDDNKVKPKKTAISEKELKNNKGAEGICPVNAIKTAG